MTDFGKDFDFTGGDFGPELKAATGLKLVGQAIFRRFMVVHGSYRRDPDYGFSLISWVNEKNPDTEYLKTRVEAEALKDERVETADATVTFDTDTETLTILLIIGTSLGPFELVVGVNDLTVDLLSITLL